MSMGRSGSRGFWRGHGGSQSFVHDFPDCSPKPEGRYDVADGEKSSIGRKYFGKCSGKSNIKHLHGKSNW